MPLPKLAITIGDPIGIGPEIVVKSVPQVLSICRPVIIGETAIMRKAVLDFAREFAGKLGSDVTLYVPESVSHMKTVAADGSLLRISAFDRGEMQYQFLRLAVEMIQKREVDAVVTAPISKVAFAAAGIDFPGQTELLSYFTETHPPVMMLSGPSIRVVPLTTHCPLADVPSLLTREMVETQVGIVHESLIRYFKIEKPRIALCALNPHAGEGGLFGREEIDILAPAAARLRSDGIDVSGPFPADSVFLRAVRGEFDVVVAPTHDQALIPVKLLHFDEGVNITLGLPIIRTSPDHGTAHDIAWKGVASPGSMIAAIRTAVEMLSNGRKRAP